VVKKVVKKLQLSRETLRDLKDSEIHQAAGGSRGTCQSGVDTCDVNNVDIT
jgi:hypothetical protein